jgi:exosome complex component RRP41
MCCTFESGTRCAGINAATLALIDAGIAMTEFVCACAAGCIDDTPLLDLNYLEDSSGSPDMPLALLPNSGRVTLLQV